MSDQPTTNTKVQIPEAIRVGDFAERLNIPVTKVIAELMKKRRDGHD